MNVRDQKDIIRGRNNEKNVRFRFVDAAHCECGVAFALWRKETVILKLICVFFRIIYLWDFNLMLKREESRVVVVVDFFL